MAQQKIRGVNWQVFNGTTEIPSVKNCDLSVSTGTADASDHSSGGWGEDVTTTSKWTANIDGWYREDETTHTPDPALSALFTAMVNGTVLAVEFRPNGTGSTKSRYYGNGRIKDLKMGGPQEGVQPFSFSIVGAGALTPGSQS